MTTKTNSTVRQRTVENNPPILSKHRYERVASMIEPRDANWLWWPLFPMEAISVLASPGNIGKGLVLTDITARITRGDEWPLNPDGDRAPKGNVIWAEAEDQDDITLVPRLEASRANMDRVSIMDFTEFQKVTHKQIRDDHIRLIVLSPLISFAGIENPNNEREVREGLERLLSLVEGTECALIGIMHPNKKTDLASIDRLLGSVAFANFCRSVVLLKAEDVDTARLVHKKWNWGIKSDDLLFTKYNRRPRTSPRGQYISIRWEKAESNIDPDSVFDREKEDAEGVQSAGKWLISYLEQQRGQEATCKDIFAAGERNSHSSGALKAAKKRISSRICHKQAGFGRENIIWYLKAL